MRHLQKDFVYNILDDKRGGTMNIDRKILICVGPTGSKLTGCGHQNQVTIIHRTFDTSNPQKPGPLRVRKEILPSDRCKRCGEVLSLGT